MKRGIVLCVTTILGAMLLAAARQPAGQDAPKVVQVEKVKDNLFMLRGGGGNTAVFLTANGVVVVDSKNPGWGQTILDQIRTLTDKPVTTLINTHTHADHVSGNVEFPINVDIVTHENTKANMEKMTTTTGSPAPPANVFKEHGGRGLPKRTFKDKMSIGSDNDRVDLYYFGRAHTNGDAWVVFPFVRVMHAGDAFPGKNVPFLDANNGGSGVQIPKTLQGVHDGVKNVNTIITGHSTLMTWADLKEYVDFNREFLNEVQSARKAGRTVDDLANTWKIPEKYAGYTAPAAARLKSNIQVVYDELNTAGGAR